MTDFREPARSVAESRMANEDQQNAGGQRRTDQNGKPYYDQASRTEYPRMMYRKTEREQIEEAADAIAELKDPPKVINRFDIGAGKFGLCDMTIAHDASEAEVLSTDGWDVSPKAAYGIVDGMAKATSAKDDEIAALKAQLAARDAASEPERRGPGRPPKIAVDA